MVVLAAGDTVRVQAETPARIMLIGGEPLDGPRFIWWNFVSSKRETIRAAAAQWSAHQTPRIEGETDAVPLPSGSVPV
jgi:redox-sensitive bicupin YhaK (pirin superfamily)